MPKQPNSTNFTPQFNAENTTGKLQYRNPTTGEFSFLPQDDELSEVAFSGDYNDLNNLPDIPAEAPVQSVNGRVGNVTGLAEQSDLDAEVTTRASADTTLQTNITNEENARAAADTDLQIAIAELEGKILGWFPTKYGETGWVNSTTYTSANLAGKTFFIIALSKNSGGINLPYQVLRSTGTNPEFTINPLGGFTLSAGFEAESDSNYIICGVGITPAQVASQAELDLLKTTLSYIVQTGTPESTNGYFNRTTGAWVANANYVTVKFNIVAIKALNLKASGKTSGTAMALAVYFDATNTYLGSEVAGGSSAAYYSRTQLTPPANTVFVALSTNTGYTNPPVLENLQYTFPNLVKLQSQVAIMQTEINQSRLPTYTALTGTPESAQGYYRYDNGLWTAQSFWYTTKYDISAIDRLNLLATANVNGTNSALVVYFSAENVYLGYEVRGTSTQTKYTRQAIDPPVGTKFVAIASNGSANPPALENTIFVAPDVAAIETLKTDVAALNADIDSLREPVYTTLTGVVNPTEGYYAYNTGVFTPFSFYYSTMYDIDGLTGTFLASGRTSGSAMALAVFFDASNVYLGYQVRGGSSAIERSRIELTLPTGTRYIAITSNGASYPAVLEKLNYVIPDIASLASMNQWSGKKIVWLGTSVPFGENSTKSYALEAANKLGFTLVNASVPGQAIHMTSSGGIQANGSTCLSIAEYAALGVTIASSPITPYVPGGSYNNYYRTWENIFTPENADADLWVFDIVPNNGTTALNSTTDWDLFNKNTWAYTDGSSFADHRKTVIGALLFLMDKMYTLNPNARMIFLSGSFFSYANGVAMFKRLVDEWEIGYIDIWKKINTTPPSLAKIKSLGGTDDHPSTFAHEILGKMLTNDLLTVA